MKRAVLLGTSHNIQRGNHQKDNFHSYIERVCKVNEIQAIAEEIDTINSIASDVSSKLEIKYKIIEPTPNELDGLGIEQIHRIKYQLMSLYEIDNWPTEPSIDLPIEVYKEWNDRVQLTYRQREAVWLKRIRDLNTWPVLIICGADHFRPFYELLISSDIVVIGECEKWGI